MKHVVLALILAVLILLSACTKTLEIPTALIQPRLNELQTALNLSDDQLESITPIVADGTAQLRELMQKMTEELRGNHEKMMSLNEELRERLGKILSPEQGQLLDSLRIQIVPSTTIIELYDRLKLTPDQVLWVDSVSTAYQKSMFEMRQMPDSLRPDREEMQAMREQLNKDIGEVFTADQWELFDQIQTERRDRMQRMFQGGGGRGMGGGQ